MGRVAIVIPCYNAGGLVEEAVHSALAQTHDDVEVVVVNDGSTDDETLQALERVRVLERLQVVDQENRGLPAARNAGVRATGAEFILPLDADDLIHPRYVEEAIRVISDDPGIGMVYCRAELFGSETGLWELPDFDWKRILVHNAIFCTMLFRRSDWERAGGYDERLRSGREDHDFVLRILGLGLVPHRLDGVYFYYRRSDDTMNATFGRSRELLLATSAHIMRNNAQLYVDHAEDLFAFIFEQHDRIMDLTYRYQWLESMRERHPRVLRGLRRLKRAFRGRR